MEHQGWSREDHREASVSKPMMESLPVPSAPVVEELPQAGNQTPLVSFRPLASSSSSSTSGEVTMEERARPQQDDPPDQGHGVSAGDLPGVIRRVLKVNLPPPLEKRHQDDPDGPPCPPSPPKNIRNDTFWIDVEVRPMDVDDELNEPGASSSAQPAQLRVIESYLDKAMDVNEWHRASQGRA